MNTNTTPAAKPAPKTITIEPFRFAAILSAIQTLADGTPYAVAAIRSDESSITVSLPAPDRTMIEINGRLAFGSSKWITEMSGPSWKFGSVADARMTAAVLQVAISILALIESIPAPKATLPVEARDNASPAVANCM